MRWGCGKHLVIERKNSRMTFLNPNIPALKFGRDVEIEGVNICRIH